MNIPKEKIKETILESFDSLGFTPRGFQPDVIFKIVNAFLNEEKQTVVCSLDTGAGKSIIGAVVADVVTRLTPDDNDLASIISMGVNSLAKQYFDTFKNQDKYRYFQIKGARNYPCHFMESQPTAVDKTADSCLFKKLIEVEQEKYCSKCVYKAHKAMVNKTDNLITNTSYFLIALLADGYLKSRKMHVFDEAHNMNEAFCNYSEIIISVENIEKYIKELGDTNGKCDDYISALIMIKDQISTGAIGHNNYFQFIDVLKQLYSSIAEVMVEQAKGLEKIDPVKSSKFDKLERKYNGLAGKICDLVNNNYDHVFDNTVPNTVSIKTVFVGKMMQQLLAKYNLLMSATITENFVFDTLELDPTTTLFLETPPVFPKENKPIFFIGKTFLNYQAMKEPSVIQDMKDQVAKITEFHSEESGLIIVPSFYLGSQLARGIKSHRIYEHKQGVNLSDLIADFKSYNRPAVLISPSIFEGLDFAGDHSRFQIIAKSPFPSLGDKRIKYIADNYPTIYQEMTLIKIIQGIGRSVRSEDDFAATYCLDASTERLFKSKLNIWTNRFTVQKG